MANEIMQGFFDKLPSAAEVVAFNNEQYFGFTVCFSLTGFGFGEITLSVDKETWEPRCDLEGIPTTLCGEIVERTIGTKIRDVPWEADDA